ncbi:SSI family serine proteinase inhibitor [Streptomyces sp. NPDC047017]|uniref:SSI family serine proteinase inhibitor n=1 Tax=Streptomyces sp. NPDC047017 TaxID=3155024 RepID=UPI0033FD1131
MTHNTNATAPRARWLRRALPAAALLAACAAVPAQAAPASHRYADDDWLYVTVTHGEDRSGGDTRGALLRCDPPRGHAHATEACDELRSVRGDIRGIPRRDGFCSMVYAPVTVQARGQWQGRAVDYTETFPNACQMRARTGDVFALDG